ncbi:MAG: CHASE2 domain-containing protein [Synechococcales cyanobacterium RU_4_20]|nr:CHASE2 domain-containing protein [Synechococcales cyanobacterium RU_4_20]
MLIQQSLGIGAIAFLLSLKATGVLQAIELNQLDQFLKLRPEETVENRILLVKIDQLYLDRMQHKYSDRAGLEYQALADLTQLILASQPATVALDIPVVRLSGDGQDNLLRLFEQYPELITVEKAFRPRIPPISSIPAQQLAFNDFPIDLDGNVRRTFLVSYTAEQEEIKSSLSFRLAELYLDKMHGIGVSNGQRDPDAPQFGEVEIPRLKLNREPYLGDSNIDGIQTIISFRQQNAAFEAITASAILENSDQNERIQNKIVIVGITAPKLTTSLNTTFPKVRLGEEEMIGNGMLGIELQAHATSQILSSVLDNRALIRGISQTYSYGLLLMFGIAGCALGRSSKNVFVSLLGLLIAAFGLWIVCYLIFLTSGLYLPPVVNLLMLTVTALIYMLLSQREIADQEIAAERKVLELAAQDRDSRWQERRRAIEDVFGEIHNGPLQMLSITLRQIQDGETSIAKIETQLQALNQQIRLVGEHLKRESQIEARQSLLWGNQQIDLNQPLHELLYEVYTVSLQADWPNFRNLKVKSRSFDPLGQAQLSNEEKDWLGRFLAEAICNVGKHAHGASAVGCARTKMF